MLPVILTRTLVGAMLIVGTGAAAEAKAPLGRVTVGGQRLASIANTTPLLTGAARIGAQFGVITSGFRSVEHNRRVGGVPNSYHLLGLALDVQRRAGVSHAAIDAALRRAGYTLVESLDEGDHSHFALASSLPLKTLALPPAAPVETAKPKEPSPWLADNHGVLLIDQADSATPAAN